MRWENLFEIWDLRPSSCEGNSVRGFPESSVPPVDVEICREIMREPVRVCDLLGKLRSCFEGVGSKVASVGHGRGRVRY